MKRRIDETILSEISMVNSPQFSKDGAFISFFEECPDLQANVYRKKVLCRQQSTGSTHVIPIERVKFVQWREDGLLSLFCAGPEKNTQVSVWDPRQQVIVEQFQLPELNKAAVISQDRVLLAAFCRQTSQESGYLSIADTPFWSNERAYTNGTRNRLGIYDRSTGQVAWITKPTVQVSHWFVEKNTVYYTAVDFVRTFREKCGLFSYSLDTGETRTLIPEGLYYISTLFRLEGMLFFFGSDGKRYGRYEYGGFYTVDEATGCVQLRTPYNANVAASSICCDSVNSNGAKQLVHDGMFYFITTQEERSGIKAMTADGTITDIVTDAKLVTAFDVFEDQLVYVGCSGMQVAELYLRTLSQQTEPTALTAYSQSLMDTYEIALPKPLNVVDAQGNQVHGWVVEPVGPGQNEKYPLILYIHGGPRMAFNDCFQTELQCWAAQGYGICYCNPVGSDSRGNQYGDLCGRYGDIDYQQLLTFVKAVVAQYPCFDENRVGVLGGSYGGYMVNWIIGHTDYFKAAVSERSIANWITLETMSDIGAFYVADQTGKSLLKDQAKELWDNSPLKYAGNVVTPTMFIQSECDFRCPQEETFQMFYMLNKRNIDTKVLYFKGENHNLSRRGMPRNRCARIREIGQWFQTHLVE